MEPQEQTALSSAGDPHSAKERILERFEQLLDKALETAGPLEGIAPQIWEALAAEDSGPARQGEQTDWYQMWSVLTVLSQEIKLQGRTFHKLSEGVASLIDKLTVLSEHKQSDYQTMAAQLQRVNEEIVKLRQQQFQDAQMHRHQAAQAFIDILIEMRERMMRGTESAQTSLAQIAAERQRPMWVFRRRRRQTLQRHEEMAASLLEGYRIHLYRIEDICRQYEIAEIDAAGKAFDPLLMKAVALDDNEALPEGTVVEVFSKGYLFSGRIHRPAEVKVVRHRNLQNTSM